MDPVMNIAEKCPVCGSPLSRNAPHGLCVKCLFKQGADVLLDSLTNVGEAANGEVPPQPCSRRIGDYELLEEIARGAMGVVYRARQTSLQRTVAVKMILYSQFASPDYFERFRSEAQALARLRHPNIVAIHEIAECEGQLFLSMEFVAGRSLADLIRDQPLTAERAVRYLEAVARAIHVAHQERILHRDLKPANILIDADDQPRVTDFGLAQHLDLESNLTQSGHPLGTPDYMPPEQVAFKRVEVGPWSDVYSLGAILYELLTGRPPFRAENVPQIYAQILANDPVSPRLLNPDVPHDLETICLKCLEKKPANRYPSATALADELARFREHQPIQARPIGQTERAWRWCQRRPQLATLLAATSCMVLLAMAAVFWQWRRAEAARHQVTSTLHLTELRLAERNLEGDAPLEGLSALAKVVRENPSHRVAANRLFSALNYRSFARLAGEPRHSNEVVWSADFNSSQAQVVTTTDGLDVFVWNVSDSSKPLHRLHHPDRTYLASFSPDGQSIATVCADKRVRFWDAKTGEERGASLAHNEEIFSIRFRPDGQEIVTAQTDGSVRVWNLITRGQRLSFPAPTNAVSGDKAFVASIRIHDFPSVTFSPDGSRILSVANSRTARIWNAQSGLLELELPHLDLITVAEFSRDGNRVVTTSHDRSACVWDAHTGALIAKPVWFPTGPIQAHFSPDGTKVVSGFYDGSVHVWDVKTGQSLVSSMRHKHYVEDVVFSPDGRYVISASHDGTARIWEANTGRPMTDPIRAGTSLRAARFLYGGRQFFTRGNGGLSLWQLDLPATPTQTFDGGKGQIYGVRFLNEAREVLVLDEHLRGQVFDRSNGQPLTPTLIEPGSFFGRIRPNDTYVVKWVEAALAWERHTGHHVKEFLAPGEVVYGFAADGGKAVIGFLNGGARIINFTNGTKAMVEIKHAAPFTSIELTFDGQACVTASTDGTAQLWNTSSGSPLSPPLVHRGEVRGECLSANGRWLVTWGFFSGAYLWDLNQTNLKARLLSHESEVISARFDSRGEKIVTASYDRTARVWDAATARPIGPPLRHQQEVSRAAFVQGSVRVITASLDHTARIWDISSGLPLSEPLPHMAGVSCLAVGTESILCGSLDGKASLWSTPEVPLPAPAWLSELAEALAGTRIAEDGVSEPLSPATLLRLEEKLRSLPEDDFYARWVRQRFLGVSATNKGADR